MAQRGYTSRDTNAYGFYGVRVREALRPAAPVIDTMEVDSLFEAEDDMEGGDILRDIFKIQKVDTVKSISERTKEIARDTTLTRAEKRRLRRDLRRQEKEASN